MRELFGLCLSLFLVIQASAGEPRLRQVLPGPLPDPYVLAWTIERALEKEPTRRFPDATAFRTALTPYATRG